MLVNIFDLIWDLIEIIFKIFNKFLRKKETTNEIIKQKINISLMDVIFERVKPIPLVEDMTNKERLIQIKKNNRINVQSVCFPITINPFVKGKESEILNWSQNKIHSQYSAFSQINRKYKDDADPISWNNNKMQNQRYLETNGGI
jgi:hypothetical protein